MKKKIKKAIQRRRNTRNATKDDKLLGKMFEGKDLTPTEHRRLNIYRYITMQMLESYSDAQICKMTQRQFRFKNIEEVYPYLRATRKIYGEKADTFDKKAERVFAINDLREMFRDARQQGDLKLALQIRQEINKLAGLHEPDVEEMDLLAPFAFLIADDMDFEESIDKCTEIEDVEFEEVENDGVQKIIDKQDKE